MKSSRENLGFWLSIAAGILITTLQTIALYGPIGIPLGIGTGASLGMVVFYLASMLVAAWKWIFRSALALPPRDAAKETKL